MNGLGWLTANMISCHHTFKSACNIGYKRTEGGSCINQYNSIFSILNDRGEIFNWQFTKYDSFFEVRDMFYKINNHTDTELKMIF